MANETLAPAAAPAPSLQTTQIYIAILVGVICILLVLLLGVIVPCMFPIPQQREEQEVEEQTPTIDPERIKRRNQTVEDWLVTQIVVEDGDSVGKSPEVEPTTDVCCQICIEDFKVGDRVSWPIGCDHVFHLACVQEWLLRKKDCPYCRQVMLPVDTSDEYDVVELMNQRARRQAATSFSLRDGLIVKAKEPIFQAMGDSSITHAESGRVTGKGMVIEPPVVLTCRPEEENRLGLVIEPPLLGSILGYYERAEDEGDEERPAPS